MTDLATLALKVDSTEVESGVKSLDKLTAAGKRTEGATNAAGKTWVRASSDAGKLRMAEYGAAQAADAMVKSTKGAGAAATEMARKAQEAAGATNKLASANKLAGHHTQNLFFQIQDMAVGLASGQKPMTVFMQQGSQIAGIMAQAQMGVLGMTKAIAGMGVAFVASNPLILAAVGVAGLLAAGLGLVTEEINKNSSVTVTWKDVLLGAFDVVSNAVSSTVTSAFQAMGLDIGEVWESVKKYTKAAINFIIGASLAVPKLIAATYDKIGPAFGDAFYSAANIAIEALNWLVQKSAVPLNMLIKAMNGAFGTSIPEVVLGGIDKLANPYAGAMGALGKAGAQSLVSSFTTDYIGNIAGALSDAAQNRARMREAAEKAGDKAGKAGGAKMGKSMAEKAAKEVEDRFGIELSKSVKALSDKLLADLLKNGRGLNEILAEINSGTERRVNGWEREANAVASYNEQLYILGDQLRGLKGLAGGLGGFIGALEGFRTGGSTGVGGGAGFILDRLSAVQWRNSDNQITRIGDLFDDALQKVFGPNGSFKDLLQGAGTGIAAGSLFLGNQSASGQIGSAIGGALGEKLGEKFLSKGFEKIAKGLGDFAGPLGSIAGGIIGGLVGGLLKKNKTGKATISGSGVSLSGNSSSRKSAAGDMAGAVQDALDQIADALGADLNMALGRVTVAVRNKSLRVDPTGGGNTKTSKGAIDFGQDQEAAIKYAISDLIKDGVLGGISDAMKKLLNSGNDIEKQLQKALDFKGVFDWLEQQADPTAYALKQLGKELDYLNGVFVEAGATAEEMAKLEEYSSKRRLEIMEEANRKAEELLNERLGMEVTILGLQGKATEALALARQLERDALDETLRPLLDQTYALQDAAAYREMEIQLMEALGQSEAALAARRQQTLAATVDSLKPLQMAIWAAQDAAEASAKAQEEYTSKLSDARSVLISAYNREASALQTTADRFRGFADTLREFRADLYGADSGLSSTRTLLVNLMKVGAQAAAGNETGLQALPGAGRDYLSSLKNTASSAQEYARGVAMVARYADQGVSAASSQASAAERQIALMEAQVKKLVDLDEGTISLSDAMKAVKDLLANPVAPAEPTPVALPDDFVSQSYDGQREQIDALQKIDRTQNQRLEQLSAQVERLTASNEAMSSNIATLTGIIRRSERQGRIAVVEEA